MESAAVNGASEIVLANVELLEAIDAVPKLLAWPELLELSELLKLAKLLSAELSAVQTVVFGVSDRSAGCTADQSADRGSSQRPVAVSSDQAADDRTGDGTVSCAALSETLGLDVRHHHHGGGNSKDSVFDHIHCFNFREKRLGDVDLLSIASAVPVASER